MTSNVVGSGEEAPNATTVPLRPTRVSAAARLAPPTDSSSQVERLALGSEPVISSSAPSAEPSPRSRLSDDPGDMGAGAVGELDGETPDAAGRRP